VDEKPHRRFHSISNYEQTQIFFNRPLPMEQALSNENTLIDSAGATVATLNIQQSPSPMTTTDNAEQANKRRKLNESISSSSTAIVDPLASSSSSSAPSISSSSPFSMVSCMYDIYQSTSFKKSIRKTQPPSWRMTILTGYDITAFVRSFIHSSIHLSLSFAFLHSVYLRFHRYLTFNFSKSKQNRVVC
jgi:hypothetical protein